MLLVLVKRVLPRLHNTTITTTTTPILSTTAAHSFVIMPPKRRAAATKSAPADVDAPAAKRQKPAAAPAEKGKMMKDDEGNPFWGIGGQNRRVAVTEFKGNQLVSIREHYEKDGKMLPGKKGISLTVEQLNAFISIIPQLETYLASKKVTIDRPAYNDSTTAAEEEPAAVEEEVDEEEDEEEDELKDDDHEEEEEEEVISEEDASEEEEAKKKKTKK
ncbi:uncharacterized protein H6S33_005496 [Morchella sextelata]|uniref:uncharacterized protein n=1 Tax=Morchella sextelata TaxID=1174677 RepID=UPI001D03C7FF|nr:uncharacterized protein H6S33_005496 [Morchella sextelata]KAH0613610.1 hypothetical protein H6S33_005496 [Morchella sextelata]